VIIGFIVMILFGAKKLPECAKGLGSASSEFKKGLKGDDDADIKKS
jgi:sec-independent protein translocase protein TatA